MNKKDLIKAITKERQALLQDLHQAAVKTAEAEVILRSIGEGLIAIDKQGFLILINPAAQTMFNITHHHIGQPWHEHLSVLSEQEIPIKTEASPLMQAISQKQKINYKQGWLKNKENIKIPVAITASPVIVDGKIEGAIMVIRNTAEERAIDKTKSEFVSLASHQLRTPLSAIKWYAELLLEEKGHSPTQLKCLKEIAHGSQRMVDLVNALLNVSRLEMGGVNVDPKPNDLRQIVQHVLTELKPLADPKKLKIKTQFSKGLDNLNLDENLMGIIFQNLLSNSIKYTPEKGKINLKIKLQKEQLFITIVDTGYGIPKEAQKKLFTKFFRADNIKDKDTDGNGLGLYIVKAILDQLDGEITFESEEGKGTTFNINLSTIVKKNHHSKPLIT